MPRRKHHHVYVIELSKDVLLEPRFRKGNPGNIDGTVSTSALPDALVAPLHLHQALAR